MKYNFDEMISRIKAQKKVLGFTNEELSSLSGIPSGTLNKILGSETKEPKLDTILKLSDALSVPANFLIYGDKRTANTSISFTTATTRITEKLPRLTEEQLNTLERRVDTYIDDNEIAAKQTMTEPMKKAT